MRVVTDGIPRVKNGHPFPDPRDAQDGLVAVGGEMTVERLLAAYRSGIFPWTSAPVTWWSPDPRAVLDLDDIHVPRRLVSQIHKQQNRITFDRAFDTVIEACATAPREDDESWISQAFLDAYKALHRAGFAHSVELWREGQIVAGIYGVAIGGLFAGESMFHRERDASKIALILLQRQLRDWGFTLFDTQVLTPVTELLGARHIPRDEYLERLDRALRVQTEARWG